MKNILGLDLGSSSIGWAVIKINDDNSPFDIAGIGSRIIPLSVDERDGFEKGNGQSVNQQRTIKRTQRKGIDRYQQRRTNLLKTLARYGMLPDADMLTAISPVQLYKLRSDAVTQKISLSQLGRVLLLLNQKRGYKSSRKDSNADKKDTDYVAEVKNRYEVIKEQNKTIGQWLYSQLCVDSHFRIKDRIFPRDAYINEFEVIWEQQKKHYPDILTPELFKSICNETIFYQRPLKSQKGLISVCEFEGQIFTDNRTDSNNKQLFCGPKVIPRSSPLFQLCKIWETVNNLKIGIKRTKIDIAPSLIADGKGYASPTLEYKNLIISELQQKDKLSKKELFKLLKINETDGYTGNDQINSGIQGNTTLVTLSKILANNPNKNKLLQFTLVTQNYDTVNKQTGEVLNDRICIAPQIEHEPLYRLWHWIYSIDNEKNLTEKLLAQGISETETQAMLKLDFTKAGFGNKSAKALRKLLPYLQQGYGYSAAAEQVGYNHSNSLTKVEKENRPTVDKLMLLPKNSLRQPVVEKILNQLVNLINDIVTEYGKPDEIRVELARSLKQSKEEREKETKRNNQRERENEGFAKKAGEYTKANKRNIQKMRMYEEVDGCCLYCGKKIGMEQFLRGEDADIEHVIPRSLYYNDSQQNKIPSHRSCNTAKDNKTAYDYMLTQSDEQFNRYEEQVNKLYADKKITKQKRNYLLMTSSKIPDDFITRQLNETRYISRKSIELLSQLCPNVFSTTGMVTERLRHLWGWDDVLANTHFERYKQAGLTEIKQFVNNNQTYSKEIIQNWGKRDDHRHHAIDALVVACTKQGFIQRWNTLSTEQTQSDLYEAIKGLKFNDRLTVLEKYLVSQRPFTTEQIQQHVDAILISQKSGKKVATLGVRKLKKNGKTKVVQKKIIIPRGALSEESIYGQIRVKEHNVPIKKLFENPDTIFKPKIKQLVLDRLIQHGNDVKKALASLKKEPIYLDDSKIIELQYATILRPEYVIRKHVSKIDEKQLDKVIDKKVREVIKNRLEEYGGKASEAFKDLENNPIWLNKEKGIQIKTVRIATGLNAVVPLKRNNEGNPISFVKPGNNHHTAIYKDNNGKLHEHVVSFWQAVERKKYGIPVIITEPAQVWDIILNAPKETYNKEFLDNLPNDKWTLQTSMQQNEMFVFNLSQTQLSEAIENKNYKLISQNLYRVQKIAAGDYYFRHHLETRVDDLKTIGESKAIEMKKIIRIRSLSNITGIKVYINRLGLISI